MWYNKLLSEFEKTLSAYQIEIDDALKLSEISAKFCESIIDRLREKFVMQDQISPNDEINFFKVGSKN